MSKNQTHFSEKLDQLKISPDEKELIVENGLRFRILELETKLRNVDLEIDILEDEFGMEFEELEKRGINEDANYKIHEKYLDLKALVYDRVELEEKLRLLKAALK